MNTASAKIGETAVSRLAMKGIVIVAVLEFKFDESYDNRSMALAGWLAEESEWRRLESQWQRCLDRQNAKHRQDQQITRFHATYLNGYKEEYANWTKEMSEEFCGKLVNLICRRQIGGVCLGLDMEAVKNVFPEGDPNRKDSMYVLCMKQLMVELGHIMRESFDGDQVMLIHDHSSWDDKVIAGYNMMVDDLRWESRRVFHSITTLTWKQSVGLQAADLIAYETFKTLNKRLVHNSEDLRWAMRKLSSENLPMVGKYMDLKVIKALREVMEPENFPDFPGEPD